MFIVQFTVWFGLFEKNMIVEVCIIKMEKQSMNIYFLYLFSMWPCFFYHTCTTQRRVVPWIDTEKGVRLCNNCYGNPKSRRSSSITNSS